MCVCAGMFGLVSPASRSGEGNVLVRTGFFCHTGMDVLKLRARVKEKEQETDGRTERERVRREGERDRVRERERERESRGGRRGTVGERIEWISNLAFSTPGACISLRSHACFLPFSLAYLRVVPICPFCSCLHISSFFSLSLPLALCLPPSSGVLASRSSPRNTPSSSPSSNLPWYPCSSPCLFPNVLSC